MGVPRPRKATRSSSLPSTDDATGRTDGERKRGEEDEKNEEGAGSFSSISPYELQRLERIKRNEAIIAALSIESLSGRKRPPSSSPAAKGRPPAKCPSDTSLPSRASRRLKGESVDTEELVALPGTSISSLANTTGRAPSAFRPACVPELSAEEAEEKMKVLKGQIDARDDAKAGTASYEHCLHRVRTMSDAQLERRVRTIERARGAKAKEKMLVFSHVLRAKGKTELLEAAEAALDRLVRGAPMPEKES
ncbi:unnamed protein product [Pylaiella littoralis]